MLSTLKPPVQTAVGEEDFKEALGRFASGITVISTVDAAGAVHGMTATAFSSLSLDPPLVLVAVARGSRCHKQVTAARRFGVSILRSHQRDLSHHFGGKPIPGAEPRFTRLDGTPVLEDAMVRLACVLNQTIEGGDHTIFVGLVTAAQSASGEPLIHFGGHYRTLASERVD